MARAVLGCILVGLVTLSATASARELLHKHKHHKGGHGHHHDECKTIAQVLHDTPSLKRFAAAFDEAHVPYLEGVVEDPHARATFLAVQDDRLGSGDTVFDEAPIRFQQHTILDKIKTCKARNGDNYTTLAGTTLTVVREETAARGGRHLLQTELSTTWTALLDAMSAAEAVPATRQPVTDVAFALPAVMHLPERQPEGRPMPHPHSPHGGPKCGKHGPREGPHGGPHGSHDAPHDGRHGPHDGHKGPHGHRHHHHSAAEMVTHALEKGAKKEGKHGALYLQVDDTSQRVKVLGSVHACEATVLIVSAFLNAPPTPDPVAVLQSQQQYHPKAHKLHHGKYHGHGRGHGFMHRVKQAFGSLGERFAHFFGQHGPPHKPCGKHAKKHSETEVAGFAGVNTVAASRPGALLLQSTDPELLAYFAAKERTAAEHIRGGEATVPDAVPEQQVISRIYKVPMEARPAAAVLEPRSLTAEQEPWPLNVVVEAAEALEDSAERLAARFHLDGTL